MRRCVDCPADLSKRPHARYCDACRWRHRGKPAKHVWTPERDDLMRQRYDPRVPGCAKRLALVFGMPRWAVTHRARVLGLAKLGETRKPWTAADVAFLEEHAGARHVSWIHRQLGRSLASVVMKLKHMEISRRVRDGLTMRELELCLGADHRRIESWVRTGKLQARVEGGTNGRNPWAFDEGDVLRFMVEHPTAFALARVDQTWLMGLFAEQLPARARKVAA